MRRPLFGLALLLALALTACPSATGNPPDGNDPPPSGTDAAWDASVWDAASWK